MLLSRNEDANSGCTLFQEREFQWMVPSYWPRCKVQVDTPHRMYSSLSGGWCGCVLSCSQLKRVHFILWVLSLAGFLNLSELFSSTFLLVISQFPGWSTALQMLLPYLLDSAKAFVNSKWHKRATFLRCEERYDCHLQYHCNLLWLIKNCFSACYFCNQSYFLSLNGSKSIPFEDPMDLHFVLYVFLISRMFLL